MPGSLNLPFMALLKGAPGGPEGTAFRPADELRAAFDAARVDRARPVVVSCGSGMTACVVALALDVLGEGAAPPAAVYDGSWIEWGAREDTPVVKGSE